MGQLSWNIDNDWLKSEFESAGEVTNARVQWDHQNNRSKGFGFVDFSTPEAAQLAVEQLNGKEIDGRAVKVDIAAGRDDSNKQKTDRRANAFGDQPSEPADTLFVGNLPFSANEDSVYELFSAHGDVQSVRLPTDRETGAPKGFGYVSFSSLEHAKKAMEALSVSLSSCPPLVVFRRVLGRLFPLAVPGCTCTCTLSLVYLARI